MAFNKENFSELADSLLDTVTGGTFLGLFEGKTDFFKTLVDISKTAKKEDLGTLSDISRLIQQLIAENWTNASQVLTDIETKAETITGVQTKFDLGELIKAMRKALD